jgi:rare lipoprotein A
MSCDKKRSALLAASLLLGACATAPPAPRSQIRDTRESKGEFAGNATWYGKNHHGGPTASGERFDMHAMTAAHKTLPMNSRVRCTNLKNGQSVTVRINDRGPYGKGRVIDLSWAAAQKIDMIDAGVVPVRCEVLR